MKMIVVVAFLWSASVGSGAGAATIHHQVSPVAAAQAAFDRGLLDYYAYNPEAAEHEFYTAADLDPNLAMAYWGIALANAPNLNVSATGDRDGQARTAIARAKALEGSATPEDRALIDAAAARFDDRSKTARAAALATYRDALQRIAAAYPDDPDAAALYAESALYVAVGDGGGFDAQTAAQRAAFTARMAALLPMFQAALAKFPQHVGLLHFYIHAAQMAGMSQSAVDAARQLAAFTLPPEDSHLTHMPGHTFFDVGLYEEALDVGRRSVAMDDAEIACCHPGYYSAARYYREHNVAFLLYAMTQTGHLNEAVAVARRAGTPSSLVKQLVAAGDWQGVLAVPYVKGKSTVFPYARGIASAKLGDLAGARAALAEFPAPPADSPASAADAAAMRLTLSAAIASLGHDDAGALRLLKQASAQASTASSLAASEMPALYYYSPHMVLAALAMQLGKTDVAKTALEAELTASPRSSAALKALAQLGASR